MTSSEVWDEAAAAHYDADASERFARQELDATVAFLEDLAGPGPVLELAVGTGRVAIPLATRGLAVTGVDLSPAMLDQLHRKPVGPSVRTVLGDMATVTVGAGFSLVYLVWNSLSNLLTQDEQVACVSNAAAHLAVGGRFVVEMWVPPLRRLPPGQEAVPFTVEPGRLGFDTYDTARQLCVSHHYRTDPDGTVRHESGTFRYVWPAELDLMARLAGLELERRVADWRGAPFTTDSENAISVYRRGHT